jgi:aminodeoxyfutalosine synthase
VDEDPAGVEAVTALDAVAERAAAGAGISDADARLLLGSRDPIAVGALADDLRRRKHGAQTTFVRVFEVHYEAVPEALPSPLAAGEIRVLGLPLSLEAAVSAVSAVRALARDLPVTGFSATDLAALGVSLREVGARLRDAGLDAVAEVAADSVSDPAVVAALREGGLQAWRLTVKTYGEADPVAVVRRAAELQRAAGGFEAFAPLPRVVSAAAPTTGYDDVKLVAMARLLAADVPSIQVDWPLYGPKLAQVALTMGADDIDGVAAFDAGALGVRRGALAEVTGNIRAAALEPAERNGRFERIG